MEKRNKLWRKRHQWRLFKARMILRAAFKFGAWDGDGNLIEEPHRFELAKQKGCQVYKTTGTPCSCWMCRGESYNHRDYKKDTLRIITEELEGEKKEKGKAEGLCPFFFISLWSVSVKIADIFCFLIGL